MPTFTVLTPTFNRAGLLPQVFACLRAQTFRDFEWVIVDDGSTDGTRDLVEQWQRACDFDIVYMYQENRGKHVAFNRGVVRARGELLLPLDSDDECVPTTLERFRHWWLDIPERERPQFSGVCCQCVDRTGHLVGASFSGSVVDAYPVDFLIRQGAVAERWGFHRLEVLREFPFPEHPQERFVPEGLIWNRIARRYKMRFIAEALRIYEPAAGGLNNSIVRLRMTHPRSACQYYREYLQFDLPPLVRARTWINYVRFYFHWRRLAPDEARFAVSPGAAIGLPLGYAASLLDRLRG